MQSGKFQEVEAMQPRIENNDPNFQLVNKTSLDSYFPWLLRGGVAFFSIIDL